MRTSAVAAGILLIPALVCAAQGSVPFLLKDGWELQSSAVVPEDGAVISKPGFKTENWHKIRVPSTVLAALVGNGVFPDPYFGENLKDIPGYQEGRWLVMPEGSPFKCPWWYRVEFRLPPSFRGRFLSLHLDGINYRANVWLNGEHIADKESVVGMFRRFQFDATGKVDFDRENCLAVEVLPPGDLPDKTYRTKQVEATTGWDDHNPQPPDANMGLWQDVYFRATGPVEIRHPFVLTELRLPDLSRADLTVSAYAVNRGTEPVQAVLSGKIGTITFNRTVILKPEETQLVEWTSQSYPQLSIKNPRVWWPHPAGRQELYELELAADTGGQLSDVARTRFGIRNITSTLNDEGWRVFYVNGHKMLVRGGAWMTSDMLLRLERRRYDALVRYAREANLNMLRSEGFSIRETDDFYSLCDEYGVMVTQQIFGRSIPDEDLAIACTEDTILRIRNHPSLVHFLGHDESFPTESLDAAYRELIRKHAPDRTYQPHSGAFNVEDRFKTGGTRTGTRELWTYANPTHYYERKEDGAWGFAQSGGIGGIVAPFESVRRMIPEDQRWPIWTEALSFHTVIQGGRFFDSVVQMLNARYGESSGIEEFCRKAQTMNYECARGMFEAYGRNKYAASGITTWKYNAAWPAFMTWHYIDWYLNATGAYYGAKKACRALHVQYSYDDDSVYVVNSLYKHFDGLKASATVFNLDMTPQWTRSAEVDLAADGKARAFTIEWPDGLSKTHFLLLTLETAAGERIDDNFFWLSTAKDVRGEVNDDWNNFSINPSSTADFRDLAALPRVELATTSETVNLGRETRVSVSLHNPTASLAFQVHLAVLRSEEGGEVTPTFWEDNFVNLLPGERRSLNGSVYTEDLGDATPVVRVTGWNVQ